MWVFVAALLLTGCLLQNTLKKSFYSRVVQNTVPSLEEERGDGLELIKHYQAWDFSAHPLTVGLEIEAVAPAEVERRELLKVIQHHLHDRHPEATTEVSVENRTLIYKQTENSKPQWYKIVKDSSIHPPSGWQSLEFVSPILYTQQDVQVFYEIMSQMHSKLKVRAEPLSAGVHVHVGFPNASDEELSFLSWLFALFEKQIYDRFQVFYERRKWARFTSEKVKNLYKEKIKSYKSQSEAFHKGPQIAMAESERERALNLRSIRTHETVEFRFANSTLDANKLKNIVNLAVGLVYAVRTKDVRLVKFLKSYGDLESPSLEALIRALDLQVDLSVFDYTDEIRQIYIEPVLKNKTLTQAQRQLQPLLVQAIEHGDMKLLRILLKLGAPVQKRKGTLMLAVSSGSLKICKLMVELGVPLVYSAPLMDMAMGSSSPEVFEYLVAELNLNVQKVIKNKNWIFKALRQSNTKMLKHLSQYGHVLEGLDYEQVLGEALSAPNAGALEYVVQKIDFKQIPDKFIEPEFFNHLLKGHQGLKKLEILLAHGFKFHSAYSNEYVQQTVNACLFGSYADKRQAFDVLKILLQQGPAWLKSFKQVLQSKQIHQAARFTARFTFLDFLEEVVFFGEDVFYILKHTHPVQLRAAMSNELFHKASRLKNNKTLSLLMKNYPQAVNEELFKKAISAEHNEYLAILGAAHSVHITSDLLMFAILARRYEALSILAKIRPASVTPEFIRFVRGQKNTEALKFLDEFLKDHGAPDELAKAYTPMLQNHCSDLLNPF